MYRMPKVKARLKVAHMGSVGDLAFSGIWIPGSRCLDRVHRVISYVLQIIIHYSE